MGLGRRHVDSQVVGIRKLVVPMRRIAFLDLVSDFVETTRATKHLHRLFEVVLRVFIAVDKFAFTTEPTAIARAHVVDGDASKKNGFLFQVLGTGRTQRLADGMTRRGIHRLFDGQQLVVEAVGTLVASAYQGVDGLGREAEHPETADVGDDVDSTHGTVIHTLGARTIGDQTGKQLWQ